MGRYYIKGYNHFKIIIKKQKTVKTAQKEKSIQSEIVFPFSKFNYNNRKGGPFVLYKDDGIIWSNYYSL